MRSDRRTEPRHTGRLIAALFAIPFVSVSSAALAADVTSTTEPSAALWSLLAIAFGVALGSCVLHIARAVTWGVTAVAAAFAPTRPAVEAPPAPRHPFSVILSPAPTPVFVPASTGRRGPPAVRR